MCGNWTFQRLYYSRAQISIPVLRQAGIACHSNRLSSPTHAYIEMKSWKRHAEVEIDDVSRFIAIESFNDSLRYRNNGTPAGIFEYARC